MYCYYFFVVVKLSQQVGLGTTDTLCHHIGSTSPEGKMSFGGWKHIFWLFSDIVEWEKVSSGQLV